MYTYIFIIVCVILLLCYFRGIIINKYPTKYIFIQNDLNKKTEEKPTIINNYYNDDYNAGPQMATANNSLRAAMYNNHLN